MKCENLVYFGLIKNLTKCVSNKMLVGSMFTEISKSCVSIMDEVGWEGSFFTFP
jgi:hypothetical protein